MKNSILRVCSLFAALTLSIAASGCSNPQPGPDKTAAGMVLGGAWGAGSGAIIGHQVSYAGEGTAIGAGFGAVAGAVNGINYDLHESAQIKNEKELASLKVQNMANSRQLANIQDQLDQAASRNLAGGVYQVFFDPDMTSLRAGAIANLEVIAESIKSNPSASMVHVVGHTDDTGDPEYNKRLAESRARSVSAYLGSRGIAMDRVEVKSYGAKRPIASNSTDVGRQLNRRVDVYLSR